MDKANSVKEILLFLLILLLITGSANSQITMVNYRAKWAYYDNKNEPQEQGSIDWNDINYSTIWPTGYAHFGYGDNDEATLLNPKTRTAYFRNSFIVSDPSSINNLDLDLIYDDGAVVYLNGSEVWRVNMPKHKRAISYRTFTKTVSRDNATATRTISNSLVSGTNVIAVEIHQWSFSSSDISFDLKLTANAPGAVRVTSGPHLRRAGSASIFVRWETAVATESIVNYGPNQNNLSHSVSDLVAKTEHEIRIKGLAANTTYFYQISNSATVLIPARSDVYFRTSSPATSTSKPTTAWVLGDQGSANTDARNVKDTY